MANRIGGNPVVVIDTAAEVVPKGTFVRLKGVSWIGATTAAHGLVIRDAFGCTMWESVATGANFVDRDAPSFTMNGLTVATIDSGRAYLELG